MQREGAFQRRGGRPRRVEEGAQTGRLTTAFIHFFTSFHHLVPNTAGDAGTATVPTVQLGKQTVKGQLQSQGIREERESCRGHLSTQPLGKRSFQGSRSWAKASGREQDPGGGMGTGTSVYLQRWRKGCDPAVLGRKSPE